MVGSLCCGLLLAIALGIARRFYILRVRMTSDNYQSTRRHQSIVTAIEDHIFASRSAPPLYNEAMETSRPYEEYRQEVMRRRQQQQNQQQVQRSSGAASDVVVDTTPRETGESGGTNDAECLAAVVGGGGGDEMAPDNCRRLRRSSKSDDDDDDDIAVVVADADNLASPDNEHQHIVDDEEASLSIDNESITSDDRPLMTAV